MGMAQRIESGQRSTRRRSVLVFVTCMLSAGAFGLLLPAASGAESVRIFADQLSSRELVPGQTVVLEAAVPVDSWCRLSLSHAGAPGDASDLRRATAGSPGRFRQTSRAATGVSPCSVAGLVALSAGTWIAAPQASRSSLRRHTGRLAALPREGFRSCFRARQRRRPARAAAATRRSELS